MNSCVSKSNLNLYSSSQVYLFFIQLQVKKWRQEIRSQQRQIQRQIQAIDTEEAKVKRSIKQVAKKGDTKNCKMLAKELIRSRRHKDRLYTSKAQMNSIIMQLEHQLGMFASRMTLYHHLFNNLYIDGYV